MAKPTMAIRFALCLGAAVLSCAGCRIERVSPRGSASPSNTCGEAAPSGEVWVYTSMYQSVIDELTPLLERELPEVEVRWYRAGSEKVSNRLEAEIAAGGIQADLLATSDPFIYERFRREDRLLPHASIHSLKIPRSLVARTGHYVACRVSTMVLVHRKDMNGKPPEAFRDIVNPAFRGRVAIGDPLTSGTASTWSVFMAHDEGEDFYEALRKNAATVAGGNSAVLRRVEGGEADIGVLLLENALAAVDRGSPIEIVLPKDGPVLIPGFSAVFRESRNPVAAQAVEDLLLSPSGQRIISELGAMHAVDPALPGPSGMMAIGELEALGRPWTDELLAFGLEEGARLKRRFSEVFAR